MPVFLLGLLGYFMAVYPVQSIMFKGYAGIVELLGLTLLATFLLAGQVLGR